MYPYLFTNIEFSIQVTVESYYDKNSFNNGNSD